MCPFETSPCVPAPRAHVPIFLCLRIGRTFNSSSPEETSEGTSSKMVQLIFQTPCPSITTICTSISQRASTKCSPDVSLLTLFSPSHRPHIDTHIHTQMILNTLFAVFPALCLARNFRSRSNQTMSRAHARMSGRAYESPLSMSRLVYKLKTNAMLRQCGWSGTNTYTCIYIYIYI